MTDNTTIPLNKLLAWDGNVRKTDLEKGLDELAASIAAHGLLQSLVVRKDRRGKYAVVAGRRRLCALQFLAENGKVQKDMAVPCTVIDDDADATEVSLAENVQREPMHPADEFEAFRDLIDKGTPVADVAARFGVSESVVEKRLKLARVSPSLLAAYRKGEMTLQHVMAFAATDDHAAQERVWNSLEDWQKERPNTIRKMLTEHEITAADRRVKFVTLEAYEQAGGTTRRDLFTEEEQGVFIDDAVLLETLVARKLDETAAQLRKQGWKWVEVRAVFDHGEWSDHACLYPEPVALSAEEQAELDALNAEYEALCELDETDEKQQERLDAIIERVDEIENRATVWPAETLAIAGCVVSIGHDGKAAIREGLVRPEDAPEDSRPMKRKTAKTRDVSSLPSALIESLTAERSAALNAVLMQQPVVALAAVVHALALGVLFNGSQDGSALQIRVSRPSLHRVEGSPASDAIGAAGEQWADAMPSDPVDLFAWCLHQPQEELMRLLAFCAARSVNAVQLKSDRDPASRMAHAAHLADALKLDMTAWFTPTAENYFGRVSKAQIIDALREVKGAVAPAWSGMKKGELAALAERTVAGTGWLPALLRAPPSEAEPEA